MWVGLGLERYLFLTGESTLSRGSMEFFVFFFLHLDMYETWVFDSGFFPCWNDDVSDCVSLASFWPAMRSLITCSAQSTWTKMAKNLEFFFPMQMLNKPCMAVPCTSHPALSSALLAGIVACGVQKTHVRRRPSPSPSLSALLGFLLGREPFLLGREPVGVCIPGYYMAYQ